MPAEVYIPGFDPTQFYIALARKHGKYRHLFEKRGYFVKLTDRKFEEKPGIVQYWVETKK